MLTSSTLHHQVHGVNMYVVSTSSEAPRAQPYHHGDLRNALIRAAVDLARSGGPDAVVLREAARRVGVSATAAYRHFDSLPDLVQAVAIDSLGSLARSMEAELSGCGSSSSQPWDRMLAIGRGYVRFALAEPGLFAVVFAHPKSDEVRDEGVGESGLSAYELLRRALEELVAAGDVAPADMEPACMMAWAGVHGLSSLLLGPLVAMPAAERDALIESTLDLIGRGLLARETDLRP